MRRLVAAIVIGIALVGSSYLGSLNLGNRPTFECINTGFGPPTPLQTPPPPGCSPPSHYQEGWQIPVSILIGALGVAGGMVLWTRPKRPLGNSAQAA
jgi:hypothetical protein